jgi:hypothetical protein
MSGRGPRQGDENSAGGISRLLRPNVSQTDFTSASLFPHSIQDSTA